MSVVDAPERFVAEPTDETLAESAVEDVFVVRTRVARAPTWPGFLPRPHRQARARNVYALVALTGQQLHDNAYPVPAAAVNRAHDPELSADLDAIADRRCRPTTRRPRRAGMARAASGRSVLLMVFSRVW